MEIVFKNANILNVIFLFYLAPQPSSLLYTTFWGQFSMLVPQPFPLNSSSSGRCLGCIWRPRWENMAEQPQLECMLVAESGMGRGLSCLRGWFGWQILYFSYQVSHNYGQRVSGRRRADLWEKWDEKLFDRGYWWPLGFGCVLWWSSAWESSRLCRANWHQGESHQAAGGRPFITWTVWW